MSLGQDIGFCKNILLFNFYRPYKLKKKQSNKNILWKSLTFWKIRNLKNIWFLNQANVKKIKDMFHLFVTGNLNGRSLTSKLIMTLFQTRGQGRF